MFDHATGKPKGFGFCEYKDAETAASALRNLQGVEVAGRGLRLDFADTDNTGAKKHQNKEERDRDREKDLRGGGPGAGSGGGQGRGDYGGGRRMEEVKAKPLPGGVPLPPGVSATDSISQTLATMPPGQLLDIMSQMKVSTLQYSRQRCYGIGGD